MKSLEAQGVEVAFGLPGGAILPVYDPILDSTIRHIHVRHEQGAGHAAEGYADVTGRPGVAIVTSGPGATNIVTQLADAYMDSVPLVVVAGQVAAGSIGTDAFQEVDTTGVTMGVTKHNYLVKDVTEISRVVAEAFYIATTGRPGPVLIDFPKDVANTRVEYEEAPAVDLPGYAPPAAPDPEAIRERSSHPISRAPRSLRRGRRHQGGSLRRARRARRGDRDPRRDDADGAGRLPRLGPALPRHAGHARRVCGRDGVPAFRPARVARHALRRPGDGQGLGLRTARPGHPRRHRPRGDRQGPPAGRRGRRRLPAGDRGARFCARRERTARRGAARALDGADRRMAGTVPLHLRHGRRQHDQAAVRRRAAA